MTSERDLFYEERLAESRAETRALAKYRETHLPCGCARDGTAICEEHAASPVMAWFLLRGTHPDQLGYVPDFLSKEDPRPAAQQIAERYVGGWRPFQGFTLHADDHLTYPGDPPTMPLARTWLRHERIVFYEHSWLAVIQPDRSFEIARLD